VRAGLADRVERRVVGYVHEAGDEYIVANRVSSAKHQSRATGEKCSECWVERSVEVENTREGERRRCLGRVDTRKQRKKEASGAREEGCVDSRRSVGDERVDRRASETNEERPVERKSRSERRAKERVQIQRTWRGGREWRVEKASGDEFDSKHGRMTVDTRARVKRSGTRGGQVQVSLRGMLQDRRRMEFGEERAKASG
jgi:hypothetical protein